MSVNIATSLPRADAIAKVKELLAQRKDYIERSVSLQELARDCRVEANALISNYKIMDRELGERSVSIGPR